MARLIVFEGPRCTGKTQIAQRLRQGGVNYSTLINFTGFKEDGELGLHKISKYYDAWMRIFADLNEHDITLIADRIFFSEMVYSKLYKNYDFTAQYEKLCNEFMTSLDRIDLFFLVADEESLADRVKRDKADFAGVGDDIEEILKQQEEYLKVFANLTWNTYCNINNFKLHYIDTSRLTQLEVEQIVLDRIKGADK